MNIEEAMKQATPGPLVKDHGSTLGHIKSTAPHPKGYTPTVCRYDCCHVAPSITSGERQATAALLSHCYNHFPKLLKAARKGLTEMKESLACIGGCDHSVGICCCGLIDDIAEVAETIIAASEVEGI